MRAARSEPSLPYDRGTTKPRRGALQSSWFVNHEDVCVLKENVQGLTVRYFHNESLPTRKRGIIT